MLSEEPAYNSQSDEFSDNGSLVSPYRKNRVDPHHIDEFNEIISKIASLKDRDAQISKGINKLTTKVCNTAVKLATEDNDSPLNRIDQAIVLNFASSKEVEHDLNKVISEKMNFGQMFRYPEKFQHDQTRKKDLIPRKVPVNKKIGININYAIEALFSQKSSEDQWNLIINHEWFELSTDTLFTISPELLPVGAEYISKAGVLNITQFFDMDAISDECGHEFNIFDQDCYNLLIKHAVKKISSVD